MDFAELLMISIGLAMDAFAVAVGKGLCTRHLKPEHYLSVGLWFGGFQGLMPVVGYVAGVSFATYVTSVDHWIAFVLLSIIGGNMIKESFSKEESDNGKGNDFGLKTMLIMAIATSIDALAIGVSLAFLQVGIMRAALAIGIITFFISVVGLKMGNVFGARYKHKAEFTGGLILVLMGIKILVEHTFET